MAGNVLADFRVIVVPGMHNSGAGHWQTRWQALYPAFERVEQDDWDHPDLDAWSTRLDQLRGRDTRPVLFAAHSFGCLAAVHSVSRDPRQVAGLLLVAPADPHKFGVADALPQQPLAAASTVIASTNDPWMKLADAALWAGRWGSQFIDAGALGHINAESQLGDWPAGLRSLQGLPVASAQRREIA